LLLDVSFAFQFAKTFFLCVGGDRVFADTGMALGKQNPMIKDPIIWLELLCQFEGLSSAQTNWPILIHLSTDYFTHFTSPSRPQFLHPFSGKCWYIAFFALCWILPPKGVVFICFSFLAMVALRKNSCTLALQCAANSLKDNVDTFLF